MRECLLFLGPAFTDGELPDWLVAEPDTTKSTNLMSERSTMRIGVTSRKVLRLVERLRGRPPKQRDIRSKRMHVLARLRSDGFVLGINPLRIRDFHHPGR